MSDMVATGTPRGAVPISFGNEGVRCFGWFHAAHLPKRELGVVLCRPAGYEGTCAYETYTQLAEQLALAGYAVLRFDYHGTGDSAGSDTDPDRVRAWVESIKSAAIEVRRHGNISRISFFGVRLGATLAARAASELGGADSLIMWAPCVTGRAFARELRASGSLRLPAQGSTDPDGLEALGFTYTAQTLHDLNTLDCQRVETPPAPRILIIGRDDMPAEGPLPNVYAKLGADTKFTVLPGYSSMIVEPHEGNVAHETIGAIIDWLNATSAPQDSLPQVPAPNVPASSDSVFDGVREKPLIFGPEENLFGILAQPAQLSTHSPKNETAILMLNVGTNHRVGPNRLYVKMARSWAARGYGVLRFDLAGIGDSRSAAGYSSDRLYSKGSTLDVQSAIDCLVGQGYKRFVVMGLCSGAYVAFQTALADLRVTGQILMNPRRLEWKEGETLQSAMQISYKSTHYYKRALLDVSVYRRLLRNEIDVRGIAGRIRVLIQARIARAVTRLLSRSPGEEDVLANLKLLSAKGTDTLMIIGAEDDGLDYIEFHLGSKGSRMLGIPHFKMAFVDGSDHTFSNSDSQKLVIKIVQEHLDKVVMHNLE